MLTAQTAVLVVIDMQGKLAQLMHQKERLFANGQKIIKGAQRLDIPIILTEQVPQKLGPTIPEIDRLLVGQITPISKSSFSCCGEPRFLDALKALHRDQILIVGIETHVCVYQTVMDLLDSGYEAQVITDAVSSRTPENRQIGLERMKDAGAILTSTEMALFELLQVAEGDKFREISKIVK